MAVEKELISSFIEEYEGGIEQLEKERNKNAVILLSKSAFALCDLLIYKRLGRLPKNHSERFLILKEYFLDVYNIIENIFVDYVDAYSKPILKEVCVKIKNGIRQIAENKNLPEEIKKIIKQ